MKASIAIGISGMKDARIGYQPLIDINGSPDDLLRHKPFPTQVKSEYYVEFQQNSEYSMYTYVANPLAVHGYGSLRPGALSVSLAISKGYRVTGYTPYTLLLAILDIFRNAYMTQRQDGSYEFRPGVCFSQPLDKFIATLELEECKGRYVEMTGDKPGAVAVGDNMEAFFADPQYSEFSNYSKIIVAEKFEGSTIVASIPRPVNYKVYYRSQEIGTITSRTEVFKYTFASPNEYHEDTQLQFSLADNGQSAKNCSVQIDEENEIVNLIPTFAEKTFLIALEYDIPEDFIYAGAEFYMHTAAGRTITLPGLESEVRQIEISGADFSKELSFGSTLPSDFKLDCTLDRTLHKISLKITKVPIINTLKLCIKNGSLPEAATLRIKYADGEASVHPLAAGKDTFLIPVACRRLGDRPVVLKLRSRRYIYDIDMSPFENNEEWMAVIEAQSIKDRLKSLLAGMKDWLHPHRKSLIIAVISMAIISGVLSIFWTDLFSPSKDFIAVENLLKDIPEIQCESQTGNIYVLNNWYDIFYEYKKAQNSSYLTAKEKLDSANSIISRYKESNEAALDKGRKKQTKVLIAMTDLYEDKKQAYDTVKINVERQIKHFSKLMTDLKVKDYEFRFDDAYKIGEWLEKAEQCNLVDTSDVDYKFVKDCNQYFVDFVKILVNNHLKMDLSNIDKYTDNNEKYKISKDLYYDKNFKIIDKVNDSMYRAELQAFRYDCLELFDRFAQKRFLHRVLLRGDADKYFYDIDTFIDIKSGYMRY